MAKLYPPQLDNQLPAFTSTTIVVPFQLNRAVGKNDFIGIAYQIKASSTSQVKWQGTNGIVFQDSKTQQYYAQILIDTTEATPLVGQFYKLQIAFINHNNEIGYYSDIGIMKYTAQPTVTIEGLSGSLNYARRAYTGRYESSDSAEKVYYYRFDVRNPEGTIVATSGAQIHNSSTDSSTTTSIDSWNLPIDLQNDINYTITYTVRTLNNLVVSSPAYTILNTETVDLATDKFTLEAESLPDEGCIKLTVKLGKDTEPSVATGSFVISRSRTSGQWQEMYYFDLLHELPTNGVWKVWEDLTVEQGVEYTYSLQAYNHNGIYSNRIETKASCDFEDAFLSDGERQLNLRFNPKVSSFKTTTLESKQDTIGGKYPFFFRNGNVGYKDFPISGLISVQMDSQGRFLPAAHSVEARRTSTSADANSVISEPLHNLTQEVFVTEREFKLEVLNWLNDGKPKLFRSPGEGNYVVRLMNVSLSPIDTLGRMLHTFNCQAYEIAPFELNSITELGLYRNKELKQEKVIQIAQEIPTAFNTYTTLPHPAYGVEFTDLMPGSTFTVYYQGHPQGVSYTSRAGGSYSLLNNETPIVAYKFTAFMDSDTKFIYWYYDEQPVSSKNNLQNITIQDTIMQITEDWSADKQAQVQYLRIALIDGFNPTGDAEGCKINGEDWNFSTLLLNVREFQNPDITSITEVGSNLQIVICYRIKEFEEAEVPNDEYAI